MTDDKQLVELRSFGRRRGRKPSPRQARLLEDVLPKIAIDPARPLAGVAANTGDVWLEIGFGGGEHLIWQASHNPTVACIGCEPFEDGVVKVLDAIEREAIANIRLHMGDARDVLRALPDASIARAFVLFPDPWPKRKHKKRRLVNEATLAELARVVRSGGELRVATDIDDYAATMFAAFAREPRFVWTAQRPADWRERPADWPATRYEAKAGREGRRSNFLRFRRVETR